MKSKWFVLLGLVWGVFGASAHAFEQIEANVKYPVGMGQIASGYTSTIGFGASFYFKPMIEPEIPNYLSIGYQSYRIRADGSSQLHLIPVLFSMEFNGKVFSDFNSTFALGAGGAASFVGVTGQTSFNWSMYFVTQIKPGFEWMLDEGISLVGHTPITMFISRSFMSSMDFDIGVKFKL
jgi:hypothetical protein